MGGDYHNLFVLPVFFCNRISIPKNLAAEEAKWREMPPAPPKSAPDGRTVKTVEFNVREIGYWARFGTKLFIYARGVYGDEMILRFLFIDPLCRAGKSKSSFRFHSAPNKKKEQRCLCSCGFTHKVKLVDLVYQRLADFDTAYGEINLLDKMKVSSFIYA
jgi:hypothetical protein